MLNVKFISETISFTDSLSPGSSLSTISVKKGYIRCRYRSLQHLDNLEIACLQLGSVPMTSLQDMCLNLRKPKSISIDSDIWEKKKRIEPFSFSTPAVLVGRIRRKKGFHPNRNKSKEKRGKNLISKCE